MRARATSALLLVIACTGGPLPIEEAPCPCLPGYICCERTGRCVPDEPDACPPAQPELRIDRVAPSFGPVEGGTTVTIEGVGFEGAAPRIGGSVCLDVVDATDSSVGCVTAPGSPYVGVVDVEMVATDGRRTIAEGTYAYELDPLVDYTHASGVTHEGGGDGVATFHHSDGGPAGLVVVHKQAGVEVFQGRSAGRFVTQGKLQSIEFGLGVLAADLDADGAQELLVTNESFGVPIEAALHMFTGDGAGTFTRRTLMGIDQTVEIRGLRATDLDGDGQQDLVGCRRSPDTPILLAHNLGGGVFVEQPDRVAPFASAPPRCYDAAVGDFDRDGDGDLFVCGDYLALLRNDAGRLVPIAREADLGLTDVACRAVAWVDVDTDGDLDLAYQSTTDQPVGSGTVVLLNDGGRLTLAGALELAAPAPRCPGRAVDGASLTAGARTGAWLDVDHDADLDLFLPSSFDDCAERPVLYVNTAGRFEARSLLAAIRGATGAIASDIDGDADLDIVVNSRVSGALTIVRNNLIDNARTPSGPAGGYLRVVAPGAVSVEIDLDGPAGAPDFEIGAGKLLVAAAGAGSRDSWAAAPFHFGLGATPAPVSVRARFAGGADVVEEVHALDRTIHLSR